MKKARRFRELQAYEATPWCLNKRFRSILAAAIALSSLMLIQVIVPGDLMVLESFGRERQLNNDYFKKQKLRIISLDGEGVKSNNIGGARNVMMTPDYSALCTYSIFGDSIYDVILIEDSRKQSKESLKMLGTRIRQRFPDAVIMFIHLKEKKKKSGINLLRGLTLKKLTSVFNDSISESLKDDFLLWLRGAIKDPAIQGILLDDYEVDIDTTAQFHRDYYLYGWVKKVLREIQHKRSDRVNPWAYTDKCVSVTDPFPERTNMLTTCLNAYGKNGEKCSQHALETHFPQLNSIEVVNDLSSDQQLFISHMPTNIETSIEVTSRGGGKKLSADVTTAEEETSSVVNVITQVGQIPKGHSQIVVKQHPTEETTPKPFQIMGYIMTPKSPSKSTINVE